MTELSEGGVRTYLQTEKIVLVLKVGDRGATAVWDTPCFHELALCSIPHGSYIDLSDSPVVFPIETLASWPPAIS